MRKRPVIALATALLLPLTAGAAEITLDEIIANNARAKGGLHLHALDSVRISGKMDFGGGLVAPFTLTKKRPENMRLDFTIHGVTATHGYDGTTGWMIMPFIGRNEPEIISGDTLQQIKQHADFDGPLIDYASKGNTPQLVGIVEIENRPAYEINVTTRDGAESVVFIDSDSFLETKIEVRRRSRGAELETETMLTDYRDVGGIRFPHAITVRAKGAAAGQTITVEKIELNPAIDDGMFTMPVAQPAAKSDDD